MNDGMVDRLRRWFEYEQEAHARVLESLRSVPEPRRHEAPFQHALDLFAHLIAARRLWLHRLGAVATGPAALFPAGAAIAELDAGAREMHAAWVGYLGRLDEPALARACEYGSTEGGRFRTRVEDLLIQLFGHSWYHRGQIAALVRSLGGQPAVTDFVFWAREPI